MANIPYPLCETTENLVKATKRLKAELSMNDLPPHRQRECQTLLYDIKAVLRSRIQMRE